MDGERWANAMEQIGWMRMNECTLHMNGDRIRWRAVTTGVWGEFCFVFNQIIFRAIPKLSS